MDKIQLSQFLKERLAEHLEMSAQNIKEQDKFSALGLSSAKATLLSVELSEKLGKKISPTAFYAYPVVNDLIEYLVGTPQKQAKKADKVSKNNLDSDAIAIVGMSCRFPQAPNLRAFWGLLEGGKNAITEIPANRWNIDDYYDEDSSLEGKIQTRYGGFVDGVDEFDPYFFDISPREASEMSPDQKICMELAWEAFAHAKIRISDLEGSKTGVFIGNVWNDFAHLRIKKYAPINQHSAVGQSANIIANRISYAFGFQGPSLVIDSACSSSLYTIHLACQAIREGDCEVALAGGVNVMLDPETYIYLTKFGGLSPTGQCHTFDASADGYVRGEGAGMIVLKPLAKALKEGDRIFAVVRGSAVNNDGASNSLTAPNMEAQKDVLRTAYQRAGIKPHEVHYVEAHGTGTKLGDPIEAEALSQVLGDERDEHKPLLLGSVKTNIGHLEGAAGIAGVIKAVLAIQKQKIPQNLNFHTPNPYIPFEDWKLKVVAESIDWKTDAGETRKAGVSSFGWGGTNAHVVLEEYIESKPEILVVSAESEERLFKSLKGIHKLFEKIEETDSKHTKHTLTLKSLCATYANYPTNGQHRIALKADSLPELQKKLIEVMADSEHSKYSVVSLEKEHKVAYVVSPLGGQYIGMGINLLENDKYFRAKFKACDYYFKKLSGWSLVDKLYNLTNADLEDTGVIVPILSVFQIALAEQLDAHGIKPDAVIGHSIGEMGAAHIAGFLTLEDTMEVVYHYSRCIASLAGPYAMAVINRSAKLVKKDILEYPSIGIAAINSETSCNISGLVDEVDEFIKKLGNEGVKVAKININTPPHTYHVEVFREELERSLSHIKPLVPKMPMYSTTLGKYLAWEDVKGDYWYKNLRNTVLFSQAMKVVLHDGYNTFLELHPTPVLKYFVNEAISHMGKKATIHHALERGKEEITTFQNLLMLLYLQEFDVQWNKRYSKYLVEDTNSQVGEYSIAYDDVLPLPISAKTEQAVKEYIQNYVDFLQYHVGNTEKDLYDLCAITALKKSVFDYRVCFTGKTKQEFLEKMTGFLDNPNSMVYGNLFKSKKMAFVFSGQGSQWLGMGKKLMEEYDVFREHLEECSRSIVKHTDWNLIEDIKNDNIKERIGDADVLQPYLFAIQVSLAKLWISWGVIPDSVIGHSMGEIAAAHIAGALKLDDAAKIVCERSKLMKTLSGKGAMLFVKISYEKATALCSDYGNIEVAVNNSIDSCVVGGDLGGIEALETYLNTQGIFYKRVKMDVASHTFHMDTILPMLKDEFQTILPTLADMVIYSSVEGKTVEGTYLNGEYWVRNVRQQVHFAKAIDAMIIDGHGIFVEVSPHPVLTTSIAESLKLADKETESMVVGTLLRDEPEDESIIQHMAELYAVGVPIQWKKIYRPSETFVELPDYPLNRERFTIQDRSEEFASVSLKRNDGSAGHPFLEQYIELADQSGVDIWETRLNMENIPFLNAYKANGTYHFPIAAYLEMLEAATDEVSNKSEFASHSLFVQKAIVLSDDYNPIIQLKIKKVGETQSDFEIFVANLKDKAFKKRQWELVANGNIHLVTTPIEYTTQPIKSWVKGRKESLLKKDYYTFLQTLGLDYEPDYQCVEKVWSLGNRVIAQVVPTEKIKKEQLKYKLHPLIIGSCIRTMFFIMPKEMYTTPEKYDYQVASLEDMYISNQTEYQSPFWAECELLPEDKQQADTDGVIGNFTLYDNEGKVIAKSHNFKLKKTLKQDNLSNWLYQVKWEEISSPITPHTEKSDDGVWIVFTSQNLAMQQILQKLDSMSIHYIKITQGYDYKGVRSKHNNVWRTDYVINPTDSDHFNTCLQSIKQEGHKIHGIVYAWAEDQRIEEHYATDLVSVAHTSSSMGLIYTLQALKNNQIMPTVFNLMTQGSQQIEGDTKPINIVQSAVWSMGRVLANECDDFPIRRIDISEDFGVSEAEIELCLKEILSKQTSEGEIAIRKQQIYLSRLIKKEIDNAPKTVTIDSHATHLVTGFRGLGIDFIAWMIAKGAKNFVLLSRSGQASADALAKIEQFREKGIRIEIVKGDVANIEELDNALQFIDEQMPPLKGIVHAAGVVNPKLMDSLTSDEFIYDTSAKVEGTWNLHLLTKDKNLDFFVLFSSISVVLGSRGLSAYVAGNSFLDAYAHYRQQIGLSKGLSINWGLMASVGMAADSEDVQKHALQEGMEAISMPDSMKVFEHIFESNTAQWGIFVLNAERLANFYTSNANKSYFSKIIANTEPKKQSSDSVFPIIEKWKNGKSHKEQLIVLESHLKDRAAHILKANPNKVNTSISFKQLGVDSLMMVQLRNAIDEHFQLKLTVASLFSNPTIKQYAQYVHEELETAWGKTETPAHESTAPTKELKTEKADIATMSLDELSKALAEELNGI